MKNAYDLLRWTPEELAMAEQAIACLPDAEQQHSDLLYQLSMLIMTSSVRSGEVLDLCPQAHQQALIPLPRIPAQRDRTAEDWLRPAI